MLVSEAIAEGASFVGAVTLQGRTLKLTGSDMCFFKWKLICNLFVPDPLGLMKSQSFNKG